MRRTIALVAAAMGIGSSTAPAARADIIYEQLPGPGSVNAYNSSNAGYRTADNFNLGLRSATITDLHWWGLEFVHVDNDFRFTFYADNGGMPGAILHTTGGSLTNQVVSVGSPLEDNFTISFYES